MRRERRWLRQRSVNDSPPPVDSSYRLSLPLVNDPSSSPFHIGMPYLPIPPHTSPYLPISPSSILLHKYFVNYNYSLPNLVIIYNHLTITITIILYHPFTPLLHPPTSFSLLPTQSQPVRDAQHGDVYPRIRMDLLVERADCHIVRREVGGEEDLTMP